MSEEIIEKAETAKKLIISLIRMFEEKNIDTIELERTLLVLDNVDDDELMNDILPQISKTLINSKKTLDNMMNTIKKEKREGEEYIETYIDKKESEKLINNI